MGPLGCARGLAHARPGGYGGDPAVGHRAARQGQPLLLSLRGTNQGGHIAVSRRMRCHWGVRAAGTRLEGPAAAPTTRASWALGCLLLLGMVLDARVPDTADRVERDAQDVERRELDAACKPERRGKGGSSR